MAIALTLAGMPWAGQTNRRAVAALSTVTMTASAITILRHRPARMRLAGMRRARMRRSQPPGGHRRRRDGLIGFSVVARTCAVATSAPSYRALPSSLPEFWFSCTRPAA
jgi:hypothetical protein